MSSPTARLVWFELDSHAGARRAVPVVKPEARWKIVRHVTTKQAWIPGVGWVGGGVRLTPNQLVTAVLGPPAGRSSWSDPTAGDLLGSDAPEHRLLYILRDSDAETSRPDSWLGAIRSSNARLLLAGTSGTSGLGGLVEDLKPLAVPLVAAGLLLLISHRPRRRLNRRARSR